MFQEWNTAAHDVQRGASARRGSVQEVREALAGRGHAGVVGSGDLEQLQQARAHRVLGLLVRAAQLVQQAGEGVLDVAAEHVEIGHQQLGVEVGGCVGRGLTGDGEVRALLAKLGARPWQVDVMAGLVSEAVLLPRRQPLG